MNNNYQAVKSLLNNVNQVVNYYEKTFEATGQTFSIIHACNLLSSEVVLHTRFIGYLLNPKAGHKQKDKFLKLFFEAMDIEESTEDFQVEIEKSIGRINIDTIDGGRIDILISNPKKKIAFAIEVKVYANEQNEQLKRYYNFINSTGTKANENSVIYLTLFGEESKNKKFKDYKRASFSEDILNWIESCRIASIDQPIIRESLTQYSNTIKTLTNQNIDNHMTDEIIKFITQDELSFKAFESIRNVENEIYQKFGENLIHSLKRYTDLEKTFLIDFNNKKIPNVDAEISFYLINDKSKRIRLYWLGKGILAIGLHLGFDPEQKIRLRFKEELVNLSLGKYLDYHNWVWLSIIDELQHQPKLNYESWELFKSIELAQKIEGWVNIIYGAYQKLEEI